MARPVRWDLIADPSRYVRGFDTAERRSRQFQRHQTGLQRSTALVSRTLGALGGAFAAVSVGRFLKGAIDEAREAARVGRQTAAVIKATGGVAKVSAKDVDRLAKSLMRKVAVDDDVIAAGANMLLTFKGVRNEVGRGNDIFNQASVAALDMTAAFNKGEITQGTLEATTVRLGKALNDPIKGITALTRAGVTFTQAQKDQIKALVEAGDVMGAQKIILGELKREFGGAAEAAVDPWQRIGVALKQVKEELGTALLPVVELVADWLGRKIPEAVDQLKASLQIAKQWFDDNRASLKLLGEVLLGTFTPAVKGARGETDKFRGATVTLQGVLSTLLTVILRGVQGWLALERVVNANISILASLIIAAGHAINAMDRLQLGSGHAGDAMIAFGEDLKRNARVELQGIERDARNAQRAIDAMHGKTIHMVTSWEARGIPPRVGSRGGTTPFRALQHGGIVRRPTMALIGEAGPEAVVPLQRDAATLLAHMRGGGTVLEDFSFFGAGKGFGNTALMDAFNRANPGFNFASGPATQQRIAQFLSGLVGPRRSSTVSVSPPPPPGMSGGRIVLEIRSGGSRVDDLLVELLRKAVRSRGGNVQAVLGSG